jgi:hypothetical protein
MDQQIGCKALGTVIVGLELVVEFLAIGPLGWAMLGAVRVHERRTGSDTGPGKPPTYCGYCGSPFGETERGYESSSESGRETSHCPICGALITLGAGDDADERARTRSDCSA